MEKKNLGQAIGSKVVEGHEMNREEKGLSNKAGGAISAKGDSIFSLGRGYGSGTDEVSQNRITNMIEPRMVNCTSFALVRKKLKGS